MKSFFFKLAAVFALLSAITTLGVHLIPNLYTANNFEEQVALKDNKIYLFRLAVVIIHIFFVLFSMWAILVAKKKEQLHWLGIGFCGYFLFAISEWFRISQALFLINRVWRQQYSITTDPLEKTILKMEINSWPGINNALFFTLIMGFFIGVLFYGIAFLSSPKSRLEKILGYLFIIWSLTSFAGVLGETNIVNVPIPEWVSWTFQPLVRIVICVWLWRQSLENLRPLQKSIS